jgi:hypothetical protein
MWMLPDGIGATPLDLITFTTAADMLTQLIVLVQNMCRKMPAITSALVLADLLFWSLGDGADKESGLVLN